ncbi:hypothetical protein AB1Y20_022680 [Prymnesium parvum]|uniref:Methyltransferase domain-containing protein n=1 Tax=Prymnesium parvum TaxID=97485 RepID=A0AB34JIA4_PRYPA
MVWLLLGWALASLPSPRRTSRAPLRPVRTLQRELILSGERATQLLCWPYVKGEACDCAQRKAHLFAHCCGAALSHALGVGDGCRWIDCRKPHPRGVVEQLSAWHAAARAPADDSAASAAPLLAPCRSVRTATGVAPPPRCTVPARAVAARMERHADESEYVFRLLREPFFASLLRAQPTRRLLAQRGAIKEVCEAYAAVAQVRGLLWQAGRAEAAANGAGLTVLDVCSGKGLTSVLLRRALPEARVVMFDLNGEMELSHLALDPRLDFVLLDLFSREAPAILHERLEGSTVGVAVGTHLCGALSSRFISLAASLEGIDAFTLCPCCLKGSLGHQVKRRAKQLGRSNYDVLVESLAEVCVHELQTAVCDDVAARSWKRERWHALENRDVLRLSSDPEMLSPKNSFISIVKGDGAPQL